MASRELDEFWGWHPPRSRRDQEDAHALAAPAIMPGGPLGCYSTSKGVGRRRGKTSRTNGQRLD